MGIDMIRQDMQQLAGQLPHREATSEQERRAAEYIRGRFRQYTPDVEIDDFYAIESQGYLFASYYAEFAVVAIVAYFAPPIALVYGAGVFLSYLFEFMGYRTLSRLLPHFETQNVTARFLGSRPKHLFVVTAHYDSGAASPMSRPTVLPWIRQIHYSIIACMVLVILSCAIDTAGVLPESYAPGVAALRWVAVGHLLLLAFLVYRASVASEPVQGANANASGVAALLQVASRIASFPIENADVWLVATGSKEVWMSGMQHLFARHRFDKRNTYFLNLQQVGAGELRYTISEGMLGKSACARGLVDAAGRVSPKYDALPIAWTGMPTDAHVPLARGCKAMSIIGETAPDEAPQWHWFTDRLMYVDYPPIEKAARFAESILRTLARDLDTSRNQETDEAA